MIRLFLVALGACTACAATLTGRLVEDHSGLPLASAEVRVVRSGQAYLAAEMETDREGRFQVSGLPDGEYRLEFTKPNFARTEVPVTLSPATSNLTARLIRLGVITGRVHDLQNQPVPGVIVAILPKPPANAPLRPLSRAALTTTADARGEYRLRSLPPGEYAVVALYGASRIHMGSMGRSTTPENLGSGYQFYPSNGRPGFLAITGGEEHRNIDFTLQGANLHNVTGKVETGKPEVWFWLALIDPQQPSVSVAVTATEKDGAFRFSSVPDGSYKLVAVENSRARGYMGGVTTPSPVFGEMRVNVSGQNVEGVALRSEEGRTVAFSLTPASGCPPNLSIVLAPMEDWGSVLERTLPLTAGTPSTITGLAPMRYAVSVSDPKAACHPDEMFLDLGGAAATGPVEIRVSRAASINGKLDAGARPARNFAVALTPADDATFVQVADVAADGRFRFTGLRPGRYRIAAYPAGGRLPSITKMIEFELRGGSEAGIDLAAPEEGQ